MKVFDDDLPESLRHYFIHAVPFVFEGLSQPEDEAAACVLTTQLGPSPSGPARLALSRTFVRWQARHAMNALFGRMKPLLERTHPSAFDRALDGWIDLHLAPSGDPASIGAGFDAYLAADASMPAWAPEMADVLFLPVALRTEPAAFGLRAHAVRFYAHRPYTSEASPGAWVAWLDERGALALRSVSPGEIKGLAERRGERLGATEEDLRAAAKLLAQLAA